MKGAEGGGAPAVTVWRSPEVNLTFPAFPSRSGCELCSCCSSCWRLIQPREREMQRGGSSGESPGRALGKYLSRGVESPGL